MSDPVVPEPADDADLLARLAQALAPDDELPGGLADAARGAFDWRTVDDELAALSTAAPLAGVRGDVTTEALSFSGPGWGLELELHPAGERWVATGQLVPAVEATVGWETRTTAGAVVPVGPAGLFELADVPRGPVRFVIAEHDRPPTRTDWFVA